MTVSPLHGRRVAITGGTSGHGLALVRELHRRGAAVAFVARTTDRVDAVAAEHTGTTGIAGAVARKDDIHPIAPVHFLMIPKEHVASLEQTGNVHVTALGKIMVLAGRLAAEQGADEGFRLIVNTGRVGRQEVMHVHAHILGGKEPLGSMLPRAR